MVIMSRGGSSMALLESFVTTRGKVKYRMVLKFGTNEEQFCFHALFRTAHLRSCINSTNVKTEKLKI